MMAQIPVRITPQNYCRRRSSVNRNCSSSNLIRIPRLKAVKTKQVLPNILSLNARSILTKTDELALVIHNQKSDIVMVSETWLSDVIPDEALHFPGIPGFSVIRNDRVNMRGGGVAVFVRSRLKSAMILLVRTMNVYGSYYVQNGSPDQSQKLPWHALIYPHR
jgi:hypothetical protein